MKYVKIALIPLILAVLFLGGEYIYFLSLHEPKSIEDENTRAITPDYEDRKAAVADMSLFDFFEQKLYEEADWLLRHQTEDGDFDYRMVVQTGEVVPEENNIVRQAGTLYGLAKMYRHTGEEVYKQALLRGFDFFAPYFLTEEVGGETLRYIRYEGFIQTNNVALLSLAYLEFAQAEGALPDELNTYLEEMGEYLKQSQISTGAFNNYYRNPTMLCGVEPGCGESDYNNGETLLALVRLYRYTNDDTYLAVIEKAVTYMLDRYQDVNLQFYLWGVTAFTELYEIEGNRIYSDFILSQAGQVVYVSQRFGEITLFNRGENDSLPANGQIVYVEGTLPAYTIAVAKHDDVTDAYRDAIVNGLIFQGLFQVPAREDVDADVYEVVKGGACESPACEYQRIDLVHHAMSAYIDALTFFSDEMLSAKVGDYF